jgi:hypothetical protein
MRGYHLLMSWHWLYKANVTWKCSSVVTWKQVCWKAKARGCFVGKCYLLKKSLDVLVKMMDLLERVIAFLHVMCACFMHMHLFIHDACCDWRCMQYAMHDWCMIGCVCSMQCMIDAWSDMLVETAFLLSLFRAAQTGVNFSWIKPLYFLETQSSWIFWFVPRM